MNERTNDGTDERTNRCVFIREGTNQGRNGQGRNEQEMSTNRRCRMAVCSRVVEDGMRKERYQISRACRLQFQYPPTVYCMPPPPDLLLLVRVHRIEAIKAIKAIKALDHKHCPLAIIIICHQPYRPKCSQDRLTSGTTAIFAAILL